MTWPESFMNKIICGDAVEVMQKIPDESIDLIVTSPPYNIKLSSGNGLKDSRCGKWKNAALREGYTHHSDCMPHAAYVAWQRCCLQEMMRILKETGAIFYVHKWRVQHHLLQDRQDIMAGFPVRQIIVWKRKGGINFNETYFLPTFEVIYMVTKKKFTLVPRANAWGDVWDIPQERNNPHPAPFPVALAGRIIASTSASVVLDPFMGSGTTAIAARKNGRQFSGIEHSPVYVRMALERLSQCH